MLSETWTEDNENDSQPTTPMKVSNPVTAHIDTPKNKNPKRNLFLEKLENRLDQQTAGTSAVSLLDSFLNKCK